MPFSVLSSDINVLLLTHLAYTDPKGLSNLILVNRTIYDTFQATHTTSLYRPFEDIISERDDALAQDLSHHEHPYLKAIEDRHKDAHCQHTCRNPECTRPNACIPELHRAEAGLIFGVLRTHERVKRFARFLRAWCMIEYRLRRHDGNWDRVDQEMHEEYEGKGPTPIEDFVTAIYYYATIGFEKDRNGRAVKEGVPYGFDQGFLIGQIAEECFGWLQCRWRTYWEGGGEVWDSWDKEGNFRSVGFMRDIRSKISTGEEWRKVYDLFGIANEDLDLWEAEADKEFLDPDVEGSKTLMKEWSRRVNFRDCRAGLGSPLRHFIETLSDEHPAKISLDKWISRPIPASIVLKTHRTKSTLFEHLHQTPELGLPAILALASTCKELYRHFQAARGYYTTNFVQTDLGDYTGLATELWRKENGMAIGPEMPKFGPFGSQVVVKQWKEIWDTKQVINSFSFWLWQRDRALAGTVTERNALSIADVEDYQKALYLYGAHGMDVLDSERPGPVVRKKLQTIKDLLVLVVRSVVEQSNAASDTTSRITDEDVLSRLFHRRGGWRAAEKLCGVRPFSWIGNDTREHFITKYEQEWLSGPALKALEELKEWEKQHISVSIREA